MAEGKERRFVKIHELTKIAIFQVAGAGDQTTNFWITRSVTYPFHHGGFLINLMNSCKLEICLLKPL
jgi:hypothetical protein